ncbi:MAG: DegQ family serine endoprotease [Thermodesulfobacteriota bacterium]
MHQLPRRFYPFTLFSALFVFLLFALFSPTLRAEETVLPNFTELVKKAGPAVVNISTEKTRTPTRRGTSRFKDDHFQDFFEKFFGEQLPREFRHKTAMGSGFIIDRDGYIVTNNHVVTGADKIEVKLSDGRKFDATVVGTDPKTDLALIKIAKPKELPVLPMGDSEALKVGQWVVAIGSPFGLDHTVTAGIVSAKGRSIGTGPYDDFIQTDASINPGNSGGPLLDMDGRAVGINTAIMAQGQGIGFAIPINMAKGIITQLKTKGEVTRGWLGVSVQEVSDDLADYYNVPGGKGALVGMVFEGDPADKAGIKVGDVIIDVNGKPIEESRDLSRVIADVPVGNKVDITLIRDGKKKKVSVLIAKRDKEEDRRDLGPAGKSGEKRAEDMGWVLAPMTEEDADALDLNVGKGVVVREVMPDGKADEAGVLAGDVIQEINHEPVGSPADAEAAIAKVKKGGSITLVVMRRSAFSIIKMTK